MFPVSLFDRSSNRFKRKSDGESLFEKRDSFPVGWSVPRLKNDPFNYLINTFNCQVVRDEIKEAESGG